ncbi:MAG: histidine phosphatase family protein [Deltaproteobacteria bacterium]|nr:histidine phosphatase family protein [Deltaproteobacteria bacterium]
MALYLVQHGENLPKDEDPDKGLSPEGAATVRRIGEVARGYSVKVSGAVHSGKKRAAQTARILSDLLGADPGPQEVSGIRAMDDPAGFAKTIGPDTDMMVVSHLPFLDRLAGLLVAGDPDRSVFKFQKGGIVRLDPTEEKGHWVITWTLMPNIG